MKNNDMIAPRGKSQASDSGQPLFLKQLREKKNMSRMELSRLTSFSTYQLESLENEGTQKHLTRVFSYLRALGYKWQDMLNYVELACCENPIPSLQGKIDKPKSETVFEGGAKISTYFDDDGHQLYTLRLGIGKRLHNRCLSGYDLIFGFVQDGTLVMDVLLKEIVYKKDQFFVLPGNIAFELTTGQNFTPTSTLLFCVKYPKTN